MAQGARLGLDQAGEGRLAQALAQQAGDACVDLVGQGRGGGDALELPGRLDRPLAHERRPDVDEPRARKLGLVAAQVGDGQHVELEADDLGRGAAALGDELAEAALGEQLLDLDR